MYMLPVSASLPFIAQDANVFRNQQNKSQESVSVFDFYDPVTDGGDFTSAMEQAEAMLVANFGGGEILLPYVQDYPMNWRCENSSIGVRMVGGEAEFNRNCIRPFNLASAPITFGKTSGERSFYNYLVNCHIAGCSTNVNAPFEVAYSAPQAVRLTSSVVNWSFLNTSIYNGIVSLSMSPDGVNSAITGGQVFGGTIRNDITDDAASRCAYGLRVGADSQYFTNNIFHGTKFNKSGAIGYAGEFDGCIFEAAGSYWDIKPGHGMLFKNSGGFRGINWSLDAGVSEAVVIKIDYAGTDPSRFIFGLLQHGNGKFENSDGVQFQMKSENDWCFFRPVIREAYKHLPEYIATSTNAYNENMGWSTDSDVGPLFLFGTDMRINESLILRGGNAFNSILIDALGVNGGAYMEAFGSVGSPDQPFKIVPAGTSYTWNTGPVRLKEATIADITANYPPGDYPWCMIAVSDGVGNKKLALSDGGTWRYMDGTAV